MQWGGGYPSVRTPLDAPLSRAVAGVVTEAIGDAPIVHLPILGGSVPLATIQETLGAPIVILPIVNHDNNQHAANENVRIQNLWDGIKVFAALFARLGTAWGQSPVAPPLGALSPTPGCESIQTQKLRRAHATRKERPHR